MIRQFCWRVIMIKLNQFLLLLFFSTFLYSDDRSDVASGRFIHDSQNFNHQQYQDGPSGQDTGFYAQTGARYCFGALTDKEYVQMFQQAIVGEIVCRQIFHMSIAQKEHMKRLSYDDFVKALLLRNDLSEQKIGKKQ